MVEIWGNGAGADKLVIHRSISVPSRGTSQTSKLCQRTIIIDMSGRFAKLWWDEPEYIVSGLLNVVGATLGGDLALWVRVDRDSGLATLVDIVDPNPASQEIVERLRESDSAPPSFLGTGVAQTGQSILIPRFDQHANSMENIAEPWSEFFTQYPIIGIIAVPAMLDDGAKGVLITVRRTNMAPYTSTDLRYVESGALRLAGRSVHAPALQYPRSHSDNSGRLRLGNLAVGS